MNLRAWIVSTSIVLAAILLPLGIAETAFRVSGAVPPSIFESDTTLLYRLVPGGRKTFTHRAANGGATVDIRINADGFRGPPIRPAGSAYRVMVYGDSFIEGEFADDSVTFVRMLERDLSKGRPTEVINAGVLGWGPDQEFLRMQRDLPVYKPNLVVIAIFADNDMGDLIRDRLLRLAPDSTLQFRHPALHPALVSLLDEQSHPTGWRRSYIARWVERKLGRSVSEIPAILHRDPLRSLETYGDWAMANAHQQWAEFNATPDTVFDFLGDSYDIDVSATPDSASARYKVALLDRLLGAIHRDFTTRGIPLVLLDIPSPIDACERYDVVVDTVKYPQYRRRRISGIVDSLATRNGIKHLDLWTPFRANDPCALYYRQGDLHWKKQGQAIAANLLVDSLAAWHITP